MRGEIVVAFHRPDDEFPVIRLSSSARLPTPPCWRLCRCPGCARCRNIRCAAARAPGPARPAAPARMAFDDGFITRKRCSKLCLRVGFHQIQHGLLRAALRRVDFHFAPALLAKNSSSSSRSSNSTGTWIKAGIYGSFRYTCFSSERKNSGGSNSRLVFPEKFAPVDDVAVAQVEQIRRRPAAARRSTRRYRYRCLRPRPSFASRPSRPRCAEDRAAPTASS